MEYCHNCINAIIAFVASNNTDIIGYYTAKETTNGVALPTDTDTNVWVTLVISINGLKIEKLAFISMEMFQHLKNGMSSTTFALVPFKKLGKPRLMYRYQDKSIAPSKLEYWTYIDFCGRNVAIFMDERNMADSYQYGFVASNNTDIIGYFKTGNQNMETLNTRFRLMG